MSKAKKLSDYDIVDCEPYPDKKTRKKIRKVSGGKLKPAKEKFFEHERRFHIDYKPKTQNQDRFWKSLFKNIICVAHGCPGVGKTKISVTYAMKELAENHYERLILCRANIGPGRTMGLLPRRYIRQKSSLVCPDSSILQRTGWRRYG